MKSIEILTNRLASLRDSYDHYTMVDKDKSKAFWIKNDIEEVEFLLNELNELKRLKDIEKELGCPLEVVFKVLLKKEGIRTIKNNIYYVYKIVRMSNGHLAFELELAQYFFLKDYQKTWWLKGEE
jgi:hypothetical protein